MKKLLVLTGFIFTLAFGSYAQKDLLQAEKTRFELTVKKDVKQLANLLSDDLIYTHSSGVIDGKEKILASIEAGTYKSIEILEQKPVSWQTTGVISGKARMVINDPNGDRTIVLRYTDVYRKEGKVWKLVAWQSLLVNE